MYTVSTNQFRTFEKKYDIAKKIQNPNLEHAILTFKPTIDVDFRAENFSGIFSFRITTSHNYKWCTIGMKECGASKVFPFVGQIRPISPSKIITQVNNPGYFTKNNDDMRRIPVCRTMLPKISTKIWTWYYSRKIYNFWSAFRWSISITSNHPKLKFKSVTKSGTFLKCD